MRLIAIAAVRFYQAVISPLFPAACRFQPTCSEYAAQAVDRFGLLRGGLLSIWRILRCNPLCRGGFDPVPELAPNRDVNRANRTDRPKEIVT